MNEKTLTQKIIEIIREIPEGKVATYGGVAAMAGNPRAARQVARVLHTSTKKEKLPWYRVVNKNGKISLKPFQGYEEQKMLLENEGIIFDQTGSIDLDRFLCIQS